MKKYLLFLTSVFTFSLVEAQVIVSSDFNGGLPMEWSIQTMATDGGWNVGNAATLGSSFWAVPDSPDGSQFIATNDDGCNCDKSNDILALPSVDLSGAPGAIYLTFDMAYAGGTYGGATETLFLQSSTDGGMTWTDVVEIEGDGSIDWVKGNIDLGSFAGMADVMFGFKYNDGGGWLFGAALDNVKLLVPNRNDVSLVYNPEAYRFADISGGYEVSGTITNIGSENVTSVVVNITEGANTYSETISGIDLASFESTDFSFPIPIAEPSAFTVDVTATNPNDASDDDDTNNSDSFNGVGVANAPGKMIFVEESTGTWCPWCPRGDVFMNRMSEEIGDYFAGVSVHVGQPSWPDPMELTSYASEYVGLVGGFPTLVLDRSSNPGIPGLANMSTYGQSLVEYTTSRPSPIGLDVSAEINQWTREMTIDLTATAHSNMDANLSILLLITEDHVTGDANAYRQANNYAGGGQGPMDGWETLGNPASGALIEYNHTLRAALGGFTGLTGIIPGTLAAGDTYTTTQSYVIPAGYDMTNLNVVATVLDLDAGNAAFNADITRNVQISTSVNDVTELAHFTTYPNPVGDVMTVELGFTENLDFYMVISDVLGNKVKSLGYFSNQNFKTTFDLSDLTSGLYTLAVHTKDGQKVSKFVKL